MSEQITLQVAAADRQGHASGIVQMTISANAIVLEQGFRYVVKRSEVNQVHIGWPRPWHGLPIGPLLSVTLANGKRRVLCYGPYFTRPRDLARKFRMLGWPVEGE